MYKSLTSGSAALTIGLMSGQSANQKMSVESQEIQLINCLLDIKFIIIRCLAIRCVFDHYYNRGFDWLKEFATTQCLKSRGLERENFYDLIDLFKDWDSDSVRHLMEEIDTDLRAIYSDFDACRIENLNDLVSPLLPLESSGPGEFPLIQSHVIVSLIELAYNVQLAYYYDWNVNEKFAKRDCQIFKDCLKSSHLKIDNIEKYDAMNLVHVNIARAMLADPEDTILHLSWIRIQYVIALSDITWKLPETLKGSTPDRLVGCEPFLTSKAAERKMELRCSRSQSYIQASDHRDMRDIMHHNELQIHNMLL